jgi:hypothetical protein
VRFLDQSSFIDVALDKTHPTRFVAKTGGGVGNFSAMGTVRFRQGDPIVKITKLKALGDRPLRAGARRR